MGVEVAVRARLLGDYAVGTLVGTRGYLLKFPENFKQVGFRVFLVDEPREVHLKGSLATTRARVQVDAVAPVASGRDPYADATELAEAIDEVLMNGGPFTEAGLKVKVVGRESRLPMFDPDELQQVRVMQDYIAWSVPA